ncbi:uncharacterized protein LOC135927620 [Gordionus sp. m RMFG-2023]|uniref:uncharacterized protein LOC135927620 n=1 Tax=Gordionus sp. m RMFG-2023 TaxID=3053472 RepID=UPI0031FBB813
MIGDWIKLYYIGIVSNRKDGIILGHDLTTSVIEVNRISDRLMKIKLCIGQSILNILSVYAPQTGCKEEEKDDFRDILDEAVMEIPKDDLVIIGGDLNTHMRKARDSYKRHHGGFGYGERNDEGEHIKLKPGIKKGKLKTMTDALAINANIETIDSSQVSEKMWTDLSSRLIDTAKSTLGLTRGGNKSYKELWWWNEEDKIQKIQKNIATEAVARAKGMAYDDMYEELHTKEGQNKVYRLAIQREKNSRDINGAPKELLNFNPHILQLVEHSPCHLVQPITEQEIITCIKHMKNNKARGLDDIQ